MGPNSSWNADQRRFFEIEMKHLLFSLELNHLLCEEAPTEKYLKALYNGNEYIYNRQVLQRT
jgi:hypothetical protein